MLIQNLIGSKNGKKKKAESRFEGLEVRISASRHVFVCRFLGMDTIIGDQPGLDQVQGLGSQLPSSSLPGFLGCQETSRKTVHCGTTSTTSCKDAGDPGSFQFLLFTVCSRDLS